MLAAMMVRRAPVKLVIGKLCAPKASCVKRFARRRIGFVKLTVFSSAFDTVLSADPAKLSSSLCR